MLLAEIAKAKEQRHGWHQRQYQRNETLMGINNNGYQQLASKVGRTRLVLYSIEARAKSARRKGHAISAGRKPY